MKMHDQAAGLRRKLEMNGNIKQAKTISIVSGKGEVGKSNVAINFSISLLHRQKKVLLIDLDVGMGNVDILLGLHAPRTIIDMFNQGLSIHEITEKGPNGLAYISIPLLLMTILFSSRKFALLDVKVIPDVRTSSTGMNMFTPGFFITELTVI